MASALSGLLAALAVTFGVILLGYVLRHAKILTADHSVGIGRLAGRIALPSLLFLAMATLDFSAVEWPFLAAVALSRILVAGFVFIVSMVFDKSVRAPGAAAALRSIFATQSNDFALGLPVLQALFPENIVQYLYLCAPIQLILINPVAFIGIELSASRNGLRSGTPSVLQVLWKVLRNPIVFSTLLGIGFNFIIQGNPPLVLRNFLRVLGNAFSACALLNLGGNVAGKLKTIGGKAILGPLLLIAAKTLMLPVLNSVLVSSFNVPAQTVNGEKFDLSLFAFILGTFPTAPGVFLYANDFGVLIQEMTTGVVLCTAVAGPMMLVTAQLANLNIQGSEDFLPELHKTAVNVGLISMVGALWVCIIYLNARLGTAVNRINVLVLAGAVAAYGLALQTCRHDAGETGARVRYMFIWAALLSIQITVMMNTISLTVLYRYGARACNRIQRLLQVLAIVLLGLLLGYAYGQQPSHELNGDMCWIVVKRPSWAAVVDLLSALIPLTVLITCFVLLQHPPKQEATNELSEYLLVDEVGEEVEEEETDETDETDEDLKDQESLSMSDVTDSSRMLSYRDQLFIIMEMLCAAVRMGVTLFQMTSTMRSGIYVQVRPLLSTLLGGCILRRSKPKKKTGRAVLSKFLCHSHVYN
eukprot:m.123443 g.123443  ORF g.123443 m.123443 type:complete len:643 (+) comp15678_c0_seq5:113-2041(+)